MIHCQLGRIARCSSRERQEAPHQLAQASRLLLVSNNDIEIFSAKQGWWWWTCLEGERPTSDARGPFASSGEAFRNALRELPGR